MTIIAIDQQSPLWSDVRTQQQERPTRITCRVCDKPATIPADHPALLCPLCLENLERTTAHVQTCAEHVIIKLDAIGAAWKAREKPADWAKVEAAMVAVAEKRMKRAVFHQAWQQRKAEGGALGATITAYEAYARECDALGAELDRWARAMDEINQAWLNLEGEALK